MIAALPMYDRPEARAANDRLWAGIRDRLRVAGHDAPEALSRDGDAWRVWQSPDLVLAQTCGLPFRARLHGSVELVASPVHDLPCPEGHYYSVIVARADDPRDFAGSADLVLAFNEPLSQSGWAAALDWAQAHGIRFADLVQTGAHQASASAVAEERADLAAIDAVTWAMIRRYDRVVERLREVAVTRPTPALPYITRRGGPAAAIAEAMQAAIAGLEAEDRASLGLRGIVRLSETAYLAEPIPPAPPVGEYE